MEEFKTLVNVYKTYPVPAEPLLDPSSKLHLVVLLRSKLPNLTESSHPPNTLLRLLEFLYTEIAVTAIQVRL